MRKKLRSIAALFAACAMLSSSAVRTRADNPRQTALKAAQQAQNAVEAAEKAHAEYEKARNQKAPDEERYKKYNAQEKTFADAQAALKAARDALAAIPEGHDLTTRKKVGAQLDELDAILQVLDFLENGEAVLFGVAVGGAKENAREAMNKWVDEVQKAINKLPPQRRKNLQKQLEDRQKELLDQLALGAPPGKAKQTPARSVQVTHTGDWQPGDEVSFSFSGTVYGPSGEKQTQDDYTDHLVGIVDSQGNKIEMPWSKLIRYKVPEAATRVTVFLMKRDRTIITTANIPVHPKGTPLPIQLPPKITGNCVAYPVSQIGQPYTIYAPHGRFSGDANKIKLRTRNKTDLLTTEYKAVAASPRSAVFNPQVKEPGSYEYTVTDEGRFEDSFDVSTLGIKLDTSRAYRVKQEGTLAIILALPPYADAQEKLFSGNFQVTIRMETPSVLAFSNGQNEIVWSLQKSEVANHQARKEFSVRAGAPGTFTITARAKTARCVNPLVTKRVPLPEPLDRIFFPDGVPSKDTRDDRPGDEELADWDILDPDGGGWIRMSSLLKRWRKQARESRDEAKSHRAWAAGEKSPWRKKELLELAEDADRAAKYAEERAKEIEQQMRQEAQRRGPGWRQTPPPSPRPQKK
jgi:hypothetical protein